MYKEAKKLLNVGFIREVQYTTWLTNMVMVKKSKRKWRTHTDYTNLNKAYMIDFVDEGQIDIPF